MNRKRYTNDPRYSAVLDNMDLLGIMDITTTRQDKNGTIVWKLPIKMEWPRDKNDKGYKCIEVASFASGYIRNQNSGYSNYQLNKRYFEDEYYPEREITDDYTYGKKTSKYVKFQTKRCVLIPIEIDRLEYLISYCLKNYYIKHANFVADGKYIPKWKLESSITAYEHKLAVQKDAYTKGIVPKWKYDEAMDLGRTNAEAETLNNEFYLDNAYERIRDLEEKLDEACNNMEQRADDFENKYSDKYKTDKLIELRKEIRDLEEKLKKAEKNEFYPYSMEIRVNGQKYKVV
tara:strand:+ start:182 stop:1048 length:867 start_codon:yes stop_codon:yes gene_type:complete